MKKLTMCLMAAFLSVTFIPIQSKAGVATPTSIAVTKANEAAEAKVLLSRLDEIKAMDKSNLTSSEKKELRKEVRATRERLREVGGGVYLSVGAIIIIILLLILLFRAKQELIHQKR